MRVLRLTELIAKGRETCKRVFIFADLDLLPVPTDAGAAGVCSPAAPRCTAGRRWRG